MAGVLLADDQEMMRMAFRMVIESQPDLEVVGEAASGQEAVDAALRLRPDVVLMDVRMPGMDGLEATRRLVESESPARIIILTTFDLDEYVYSALRAGASGFLLKDTPPGDLLSGIRAVASHDADDRFDRVVGYLPESQPADPRFGRRRRFVPPIADASAAQCRLRSSAAVD